MALGNLGITLQQLREWPQAEQVFQEALAVQRRHRGHHVGQPIC